MTQTPVKVASSRAQRLASFELADFAEPTGREEEWRFTPVEVIRPLLAGVTPELAAEIYSEPMAGIYLGPMVRVEPASRALVGTDQGQARLNRLARGDAQLGQGPPPSDRAAAAAWAAHNRADLLTIPTGLELAGPILLNLTGPGNLEPIAHRLVVRVEANARAVIVLEQVGLAALNQTIEFQLGQGAQLTFIDLHEFDRGSLHLASHRAVLGRDASLKHVVVTLGGDLVRITPDVEFDGPGGDAELLGLYLTDTGQHHEHRIFIDHKAPRCRSRVTYKGALQGAGAHSVWVGDVLIRQTAEGTDSYESNRNLILVRGARADSVPNLEIETGQIEGAGHASATGRFDDEQLFYLQSRGIDPATARRLVVHGFFAELIGRIGLDDLAERLVAAVDARLETALPLIDQPTEKERHV